MSKIQTFTGLAFDYLNPTPESINIRDIAAGLAFQSRYNGQLGVFYSIAQHSLIVSHHCPKGKKIEGLLHDAHEAYVGDITSPLKKLLPDFQDVEEHVDMCIRDKYNLPYNMSPSVKTHDYRTMVTEVVSMMGSINNEVWGEWLHGITPYPYKIVPMTPEESYVAFMNEATRLGLE